jgi:hypothetical protein
MEVVVEFVLELSVTLEESSLKTTKQQSQVTEPGSWILYRYGKAETFISSELLLASQNTAVTLPVKFVFSSVIVGV